MNIAERFAWLRAVIRANPRPSLSEVAVAAALAERFNADRGAAWPASRTMADDLRMDRTNIRRAIRALLDRGLIEPAAGRYRSRAFMLVMPACEGVPQPPDRGSYSPLKGGSTAPAKGVAQPPEQVGSRSEAVGNRHSAADARPALAGGRARGGNQATRTKQWRTAQPVTPTKL